MIFWIGPTIVGTNQKEQQRYMVENFSCSDAVGEPDVFVDDSEPFLYYSSFILAIGSFLYFPSCYLYFFCNRRCHERLYRRNLFLLTCFLLGLLITAANYSARNVWGANDYPCFLYFGFGSVAICLLLFAAVFRVVGLYFRIQFNRLLLKNTFEALKDGRLVFRPGEETIRTKGAGDEEPSVPMAPSALAEFTQTQPHDHKQHSCVKKLLQNALMTIFCWRPNKELEESMQFSYFLASSRFINGSFLILSTGFLCFSFSSYFKSFPIGSNCKGCSPNASNSVIIPVFGIVALVTIIFMCLLRKYSDSLGVKQELYVMAVSFILINILFVVPAQFIFPTLEEEGQWDWSMFTVLELYFFAWFSFVYQVFRANKQESIEFTEDSIEQVLSSENGTKAFALYLAIHLSIENLFFYKAVENWKKRYDSNTIANNIGHARTIVDQYIQQDSLFQINLGFSVRDRILKTIENADTLSITFFDIAQNSVLELMSSGVFYQFLKSKYFRMYKNQVDINAHALD